MTALTNILAVLLATIPFWAKGFDRISTSPLNLPAEEPAYNLRLVEPFSELRFDKPVMIANAPGETNRLFVVERTGKIVVITNLVSPNKTTFLDISARVASNFEQGYVEGLASLAFHPGYSTNGYFFVTYTLVTNTSQGDGNHNRLSRFQVDPQDPNRAVLSSEVPMITQRDTGDGHNLNDVKFGRDGYLYVAAGDEGDGGTGDDFNNAQKIDKDFFSAILRLDVDEHPENLIPNSHPAVGSGYRVPHDNPYVGTNKFNGLTVDPAQVRTEFFAVGFRNPWRMTIDPVTGFIYIGDVGQHGREEIDVVTKGGNYGWAYREGSLGGPKGNPPAGLQLIGPIAEYSTGYSTNQGFAVMGGLVYHGSNIPSLRSKYIFCDYVSGHFWAIHYNGTNATRMEWLLANQGIAGFGYDPRDGELLAADEAEGKIFKLEGVETPGIIPNLLSDVGVFSDLASLTPVTGLHAYDINVPFWSDRAEKRRWFSVPGLNTKINFSEDGNWGFPKGAFWVKHFDLELTNGIPASRKRIETRVLVKTSGGVYGVTYKWNENQQNATLVPIHGEDVDYQVFQGSIVTTQKWHFPSRSECLTCHTDAGGLAVGFSTWQLNKNRPGTTQNQIEALAQHGYFSSTPPAPTLLKRGVRANDTASSREFRVKSYLASNCGYCHQPGGAGRGLWDGRISTPLSLSGILGGQLIDNLGNSENRVVIPQDLEKSTLFQRVSTMGRFHMPPLATSVLNEEAIALLRDWITNDLATFKTFPQWQQAYFGSTNTQTAQPGADADGDGFSNRAEYVIGTNPQLASDYWRFGIGYDAAGYFLHFIQPINRGIEIQTLNQIGNGSWRLLPTGENIFTFPATNTPRRLRIPPSQTNQFFRARVLEP